LALFTLLPALVLGIRFTRPNRMPWWLAAPVLLLLGWAQVLAVALLNESPDEGGANVFALFFGWILALLWTTPWLLGYGLLQLLRKSQRASR
jgi:hypothetical protein